MKTAFTIIRVSDISQMGKNGPDAQWLVDVIPNAPLLGLEVSEEYRRVIYESATGWERAKFEAVVHEAMALHKAGQIQALLFPCVDRETRFIMGSLPLLIEVIQSGLDVYFANERRLLDPNDVDCLNWYLGKVQEAQSYAATVKKNTAKGRKMRLELHHLLPTGRGTLYGYDYDKATGKNKANDCLDNVRMFGLWVLEEHLSLNKVCYRLMYDYKIPSPKGSLLWSRSTVRRILRNPAYAGNSYFGRTATVDGKQTMQPRDKWVEVPDAVDRTAFTVEEWEGIQCQLDLNRERSPRNNHKNIYELKGRVYCKICGRKYRGQPNTSSPYYLCRGKNKLVALEVCPSHSIKVSALDSMVWAAITKLLKDKDLMLTELQRQQDSGENTAHLEEQLLQITKQLKGYEDALDRYLRMYGAGLFTEDKLTKEVNRVKADQVKVVAEKAELERRLKEARQQRINRHQTEQSLTRIAENIDNASLEDKQLTYDALKIKVWIDKDDIDIEGIIPVVEESDIVYPSSYSMVHNIHHGIPFALAVTP